MKNKVPNQDAKAAKRERKIALTRSTETNPQSLRKRLIGAGIQASAPRMAIASYVWSTCAHPTAEEVKTEVEKNFPMVSLATVYNTLKLFVARGLLIEVRDPRMKSIRYDCKIEPHYHFLDEESGEIMDLEPESLHIQSRLPRSFHITGMDITVRGRKNDTPSLNRATTNEKTSPQKSKNLRRTPKGENKHEH